MLAEYFYKVAFWYPQVNTELLSTYNFELAIFLLTCQPFRIGITHGQANA